MRLIRVVCRLLLWGALAIVGIAVAWALSNSPLADAAPLPRPAALLETPMSVPAARNAWHALVALAPMRGASSKDWVCAPDVDCGAEWLAKSAALRTLLPGHRAFGERCEAIVADAGFAFEEPLQQLPADNPASAAVPPVASTLASCMHWFRVQANLAHADSDERRLLEALTRGDLLTRAIAGRGRSLIVQSIGWASLHRNWQLIGAMAASRPHLAQQLLPLARPLEGADRSMQRWVAVESAFGHAVLLDIPKACKREPAGNPDASLDDRLMNALWCRLGIGMLPNLTVQNSDRFWERFLAAATDGLPAALNGTKLDPEPAAGWRWRNTVGQILLDVAQPNFASYVARQADVDLHRLVVELALHMRVERMSAAQRAAWLDAQNIDPATRQRINLTADALDAKPWLADQRTGPLERRDRIHVSLTGA